MLCTKMQNCKNVAKNVYITKMKRNTMKTTRNVTKRYTFKKTRAVEKKVYKIAQKCK